MNNTSRFTIAKLSAWASAITLGMLLSTAHADVLVSHQPDGSFGYVSSIDTGLQNADFTFNGNADIESISWWGTFVPDEDLDLFTVRIFNGLDLPDTFTLNLSASPTQVLDGNLYRFDLNLSAPLSLSSGNYFLSIMNETTSGGGWAWWTSSEGDSLNQYRGADGDAWTDEKGDDFSLILTGTRHVPEPDTAALLLLAGLGLMLVRRRVG